MELALNYALLDRNRRQERVEEERRQSRLGGVPEEWHRLLESNEHKISVFAGRRTGKTSMIARRAVDSNFDCHIYTKRTESVGILLRMIRNMQTEHRIVEEQGGGTFVVIRYENGRTIQINVFSHNVSTVSSHSWRNKEILFDEFEHLDLEEIMDRKDEQINQARHIICIGSINQVDPTYAKRWFKHSDLHYFINSDPSMVGPIQGFPAQFYPTQMESFINQLPPIGMSFAR